MTARSTALAFRLYVVGEAPNSARALANFAILKSRLPPHRVEIVDVGIDPSRAQEDGVFMTPMLLKVSPAPACRIVGSLSDLDGVLAALGLAPE